MNDRSLTQRVAPPYGPRAIVLVRLAIGFVFVTEGVQKFLMPELLGAGRFAKLGIPSPEVIAPVVGGVEIAAGVLVVIGLLTRLAAFALLLDALAAIAAIHLPVLLGRGIWQFAAPTGATGFWVMAHAARSDIAMLLACATLLATGAGTMSLDHRMALARRRSYP